MDRALIPVPLAVTDHFRPAGCCTGLFKAYFASLRRQPRRLLPASARVSVQPLQASLRQASQGSGAQEGDGWHVERILTVGEMVIVVLGAASHVSTQFRTKVAATTSEPDVAVKHYHVGSFQGLLLWAALIVNALLRARPRKAVGPSSTLGTVQGSTGSQLTKRVTTMEEELRQGLILTRGVARQLEKLGIRVRTVRQTLRDPLKATTRVATETFELMGSVVARQDTLEKQVKELTQVLLAMQELQGKQLNVVASALKKVSRSTSEHDSNGRLPAKLTAPVVDVHSRDPSTVKHRSVGDTRRLTGSRDRLTSSPQGMQAVEAKMSSEAETTSEGDGACRAPSRPSSSVTASLDFDKKVSDVDFWVDPLE